MKIVKLTAENIKRLKAVEISPDGSVQVITGRNAQGKTSVLDAIWLALGGGAASRETSRPIRDGEESASVTLDLGDLVVVRTWTGDKTALSVKSADGAKFSSPQGVLDSLVGRLSFDPLEFTRLSDRDQVAALLDLVDLGIDLEKLARDRSESYGKRHAVGLEGKAIGDVPELFPDVPEVEVSASELISQIREIQNAEQAQSSDRALVAKFEDLVKDLAAQLQDAEGSLQTAREVVEKHTLIGDSVALEKSLEQVEETNRSVRHNAEATRKAAQKAALRDDYDALTATIDSLDAAKSKALAAAEFPVDGLGFDDNGVTYKGVPFSQASSAEQIRVSLAMAMSLNPKLRVIRILDGSLLDTENLALIAEMAKDKDYQIWIERVTDGSGVGVVIEDGEVA